MSQFLIFMLYVLTYQTAVSLYLRPLEKRSPNRFIHIAFSAVFVLACTANLSITGELWNFYAFFFPMVFVYIFALYDLTLMRAALLTILLFLGTDPIPRLMQHVVLMRFDSYMVLSADKPAQAVLFCLSCLAANCMAAALIRRFLPPERSGRFTGIKMIYALFILLPVLYMGNIQYFLPYEATQTPLNVSLIRIVLCLFGLAAIAAIGYGLQYRETQQESRFISHLMQEHHQQYFERQDMIAELNRECHELKRQLALMRHAHTPDAQGECQQKMESIVSRYENIVQTGNAILDLILSEKNMVCQRLGVTMTYMIDPDPLETLSPLDVCTIFDNALGNAIEAVSHIPDRERRMINLHASQKGNLLYIHVENYYEHSLKWKEGELTTTKQNRSYHGYGIKSIRYAAAQYGGHVSIDTQDQWFRLNVVIPLNKS